MHDFNVSLAVASQGDDQMNEHDWETLRLSFPVTQRWAFFDHAAVAPLTLQAQRALSEYAADVAENGDVNYGSWSKRIEAVRASAAQLINADPLDIAFVKNTSEGIGLVAEGLRWKAGDNVLIAAEEYPANVYPWLNLADRGVEVRSVPTRARRIEIDDLRQLLDARTRLVSLSFVEFASGFRNDLDEIGALCRQHGARFFVDAIQGLGVFPLDLQRTPIDFLAADGHKWLLGPEGAGLFYVRRELLNELRPVMVGWNSVVGATDFSTIDFTLKPHAGRYESGSLNLGGIHALGASIDLLLGIGIQHVADRVLSLTDFLCERLSQRGFDVYSSRRSADRSGIVSVELPGVDLPALVRRLRGEGIVVNERAGRLRISPHCYNTAEELSRLVDLL
jgi:selenocysteine lyase/cysteine desulfurase